MYVPLSTGRASSSRRRSRSSSTLIIGQGRVGGIGVKIAPHPSSVCILAYRLPSDYISIAHVPRVAVHRNQDHMRFGSVQLELTRVPWFVAASSSISSHNLSCAHDCVPDHQPWTSSSSTARRCFKPSTSSASKSTHSLLSRTRTRGSSGSRRRARACSHRSQCPQVSNLHLRFYRLVVTGLVALVY